VLTSQYGISALPVSSDAAIPQTPKSHDGGSISAAAQQFESILLSQWLQNAEDSFGTVPGADADQDSGDEQMRSFAVQQLGAVFSKAGGLGIASIISSALTRDASSGGTHD
jgi:Rod binding domain-containing protein